MFKVWYINTNHQEITEGNFTTYAEAMTYAQGLEAKGLIGQECLEAEGARVVPAHRFGEGE